MLRPQNLGRVALTREPVDRLAHLADWPTLERELRRADDGLLADLEGTQTGSPVRGQHFVACPRHADAPSAQAREGRESSQERVELAAVSDGIAADEGRPSDDAVGEEGAAARGEEVALVPAEREEVEASVAVALHQRPGALMLGVRLRDPLAPRDVEAAADEEKRDDQHDSGRPHLEVETLC